MSEILFRYCPDRRVQGRIGVDIPIHLNRKRYQEAAKIAWSVCRDTSVKQMADFLQLLSFRAKDKEGFPLFVPRSPATIQDYIKDSAKLSKGRPKSIERVSIFDLNDELIVLIEQKIG